MTRGADLRFQRRANRVQQLAQRQIVRDFGDGGAGAAGIAEVAEIVCENLGGGHAAGDFTIGGARRRRGRGGIASR